MESFNAWEQRKKEKIEKLKKEKNDKEMEKYKKNNIHNNKRMSCDKKSSLIDRLYSKDISKRKENQMILTQIYTPSFEPYLFTKKNNMRRSIKKVDKEMIERRTHSQRHFKQKQSKEIKKLNKNNNISMDDLFEDESEDEDSRNHYKYKKIYSKKVLDNLTINNNYERFGESEDDEEERIIIENAYRNRLFKHKK